MRETGPKSVTPVQPFPRVTNLSMRVTRLRDHLGPDAMTSHEDDHRRAPLLDVRKRMRIGATLAALSGALVLSAVLVPVALADGDKPYPLDVSFSNITINKGKPIVAGTTGALTVPITYTLTHGADVDIAAEDFFTDVELYYGGSYVNSEAGLYGDDWAHCTAASPTVAHCTQSIVLHPARDLFDATAGKWKAYAYARELNGQDPGQRRLRRDQDRGRREGTASPDPASCASPS